MRRISCLVAVVSCVLAVSVRASEHPRLLFGPGDVAAIRQRAKDPVLQPFVKRLLERADWQIQAPPLVPSITKRGEPDPPGEQKGIASARALQGRVLTYCMAFTLTGDRKYRDAAVAELRRAIEDWRIWVDTAHAPPYDLMNGELCLTFGLAYDWLYHDLPEEERAMLRRGVERRGLRAYLDAANQPKRPSYFTARHNWNPVCNGGAAVLALALEGESDLAEPALKIAVPGMDHYWDHLGEDGGWDEGTGYWTYGHRYAFIAAEALRRAGRPGGAERFALAGARRTGYFPLAFNPGTVLTAGFGDSNGRVNDPILYLLGREYKNPDFVWFQDRAGLRPVDREGWPQESLSILWRPVNEAWLPERQAGFKPGIPPVYVFPSIGWALMSPSQPDPPFFLSLKNGSLAANHTHLDLNHVNVGFGNTMLAVELGSRPYPADYFSAKRYTYYELTTAGHNTVLVGGTGQVQGRQGKLIGPLVGTSFEALIGVADGAYERPTTRVRRHVVFVDKRYWVLLDEIEIPAPDTVQLRFHTYGDIQSMGAGQWILAQADGMLDVLSAAADGTVAAAVETPQGWIRPVKVLAVTAPAPQVQHAIVTVLRPHAKRGAQPDRLRVSRTGSVLDITVGGDRLYFRMTPDGWRIASVTTAGQAASLNSGDGHSARR